MDSKDFLKQLQSADEGTKRKVVAVASGVLMVAVALLWITFFNPLDVARNESPESQGVAEGGGFSLGETIRNGMGYVSRAFAEGIRSVFESVTKGRSLRFVPGE